MNIDYNEIGNRISLRRKSFKLTQEKLAELSGMSINQLSNIENNKCVPTIETVIKLSNALKVTPDYFLLGIAKDTEENSINAISQKAILCTERQQKLIEEFISLLIKENY